MSFGIFDNIPDPDRNLWGVYFTGFSKRNKSGGIDFYYIGQNRNKISSFHSDYREMYNTKIRVEIPLIKEQLNVNYQHGRGVIPDYAIEPTVPDLIDNVDTQLDFTLGLINKNRR